MGRIYGHRWTSSFGDEVDPDNVWSAALRGVSEGEIRLAMALLVERGFEWPPSAVEFRGLCGEVRMGGGLTTDDCFRQLCKLLCSDPATRKWADYHPVTHWIYTTIGSHDAQRLPGMKLKARLIELWPTARSKYLAGELQLPESQRLEEKPREITPKDREAGKAALSAIKSMFKKSAAAIDLEDQQRGMSNENFSA